MKTYHEKYNYFYGSQAWRSLRDLVFAEENGLCRWCLEKGIVTAGKEVHHIEPIDKAWAKRLERDNLVLLCSECHCLAHERVSPLTEFNKFWEGLNGAGS